jgi:hypothetical protein
MIDRQLHFIESYSFSDKFTAICTVTADVRQAVQALPPLIGPSGMYFSFDFDIEILFGLVELQAYICWKEKVRRYVPDSSRCSD